VIQQTNGNSCENTDTDR